MKKHIFLSISMLCWFCTNILTAQDIEKEKHSGLGFTFGVGYSQLIKSGNFSQYLKGGAGIQAHISILYKRFEFNYSGGGNFTKAKNHFNLKSNPVDINDVIMVNMKSELSTYYAVVYKDNLTISPLAGISWHSLGKYDNTKSKTLFTPTIGLQIQYNYGLIKSSLGRGLTYGHCLPLYLKYSYCFPRRYTNEIRGGMHIIAIGLKLYIKDEDK